MALHPAESGTHLDSFFHRDSCARADNEVEITQPLRLLAIH